MIAASTESTNRFVMNKALTQYTVPLVGIGAELLSIGSVDEAMELFQTAHQLLRDPSTVVYECALNNIQQGSRKLLRETQTPLEAKDTLDMYHEDDAESGPQLLTNPVRVD